MLSHFVRAAVEPTHTVGHSGVGVAAHVRCRHSGECFQIGANLFGSECTVEPEADGREMLHRSVERFNGLSEQRHSSGEDGTGNHDGQFHLLFIEDLPDREQAGLHVQSIKAGFREQQIAAAIDEPADLFGIRIDHLVPGKRPCPGLIGIHGELNFGWADTAGHIPRLERIPQSFRVCDSSSQFCGRSIDFVGQMRQLKFFHRHDVRIERVGFDDISAGCEILLMDAGNGFRLTQDQQVVGVFQIDRMRREAISAIKRFIGTARHDECAHRSVDDENT